MALDVRKLRSKKYYLIFRLAFAFLLIYFAVQGIFGLGGHSGTSPEGARDFIMALVNSGYIMPIKNLIFLVSGFFLLLNVFVPFSMVILIPITVNIVLYHIYLDTSSIFFSSVLALFNVLMVFFNWDAFSRLLSMEEGK